MWSHKKTCYSLSDFFERLGVHPIHAIGATLECCDLQAWHDCELNVTPAEFTNAAATAICEAEATICRLTGISPCPRFEQERTRYPKQECGDMCDRNGNFKFVTLCNNEFIEAGKRGTELIDTVDVCYFDHDEDGFYEIAQVTIPDTGIDLSELYAFFEGHEADEAWCIRPIQNIETDGTTITISFWTWDLINPALLSGTRQGALFTGDCDKIDLCCQFDDNGKPFAADPDSGQDECPLVKTIEIWRVFVDKQSCPVQLGYAGGDACTCAVCDICKTTMHPACTQETAMCNAVRLVPSEETEDGCCLVHCPPAGEPDYAVVCYLGGRLNASGRIDEIYAPFKDAIYWLAASWMEYHPCGCECEVKKILDAKKPLGEDRFISGEDQNHKYFGSIVREGTIGELKAWAVLKPLFDMRCKQGK